MAAVAALILAASGCLSPAATAPVEGTAEAPEDDGVVVTATRVEPFVHPVDVTDVIEARPCLEAGDAPCDGYSTGVIGFDWEQPRQDFGDPLALFWRVSLHADWQSKSLVDGLSMTVLATAPCGIGCLHERTIGSVEDPSSPGFDSLDVYLKDGETGVSVRLQPIGETETAMGEARIDYHLHGGVIGFRAAGEPIVLSG